MIYNDIKKLVTYGLQTGLIEETDRIYTTNALLELLELEEYDEPQEEYTEIDLEEVLSNIMDYAFEHGIMKENSVVYRDLFDTKIMGLLVPRPSEVVKKFRDPKAIAAAKLAKQSGYPKCLLCPENVGYAGRVNHPARQNHRIIPVTINNSQWGFQYSPYVYYNEHCIVFNTKHIPMKIERDTFGKLLDFVKQFPHYFVGSNADLPIVGGSILSHDHFQGGNYEFAMAKAPIESSFTIKGFEDVTAGIVKWPMSVIRISCTDTGRIIELADHILNAWRGYTDEASFIFANTDGEPHNTITPIARKRGDAYELDLVLRNNITTEEHPLGVYHPHGELHHIKKENIGLIEVMGLAVLPARLKSEMEQLADYITSGKDIRSNDELEKHADWVAEFSGKYAKIDESNVQQILNDEIGLVFMKVLEHAGVYKCTAEGREGFMRFIGTL